MKDSGYKFDVLHEQVSSSDQFPEKTHENAANVLSDLISNSKKGLTIGVEGDWGSGKSTVISLLKGKLCTGTKKTVLFFLFDAWAHEGDPLRRIFLESLINEIDPHGRDSYLSNLSGDISNRSKTVKVRTTKSVSLLGKLLFLSTLALPMGAAILSAINYDALTVPWASNSNGINYPFMFGIALCLAPFLTLLLWACFGTKINGRRRWDFFESEATEELEQNITEENERTSIEFERYFESILKYALGESSVYEYERVVIVVDNLDRVLPNHAATIWSTLQTFFQHRAREQKAESWVNKLWFLVPYDRMGLVRIWGGNRTAENEDSLESAKSFISKSIQAVVEVPAPVLSAWHAYCVSCVSDALSGWPPEERSIVVSVFQRYASRLDRSPTPRLIQNYVNQVGVNGVRWGGRMSAESISVYSVLRLEHTAAELRKALLAGGMPYSFEVDGVQDEIKQELAGILFGVNKEKGIQLLLEPVIRGALKNGDGDAISGLINEQGEAYWIAWGSVKANLLPTESHTEEYRINVTNAICRGASSHLGRIRNDARTLERAWRDSAGRWDIAKYDYASSISQLAAIVDDKNEFVNWLTITVKSNYLGIVNAVTAKDVGAVEDDALIQLDKLTQVLTGIGADIGNIKYGDLSGIKWVAWVNHLLSLGVSLPNILPNDMALTEIGQELQKNVNALDVNIINSLLVSLDLFPGQSGWLNVANAVVAWANSAAREIGNDNAYALMRKMIAKCGTKVAKNLCGAVTGQQFWVRGVQEKIDVVNPEFQLLAATCLGESLQSNQFVSADVKQYWEKSVDDEAVITNVFERLHKLNSLSVLWELAKDKQNGFARNLVTSSSAPMDLFNNGDAILCLHKYKDIGSALEWVIHRISENSDLEKIKSTLLEGPVKYGEDIYLLNLHGNDNAKSLAKDVVATLTKDDWLKCFVENSWFLNVAFDRNMALDHKYTDAFKESVTKGVREDLLDDWVWENIDPLMINLLDKELIVQYITKEYFSLESDALCNKGFVSLSPHFSTHLEVLDGLDVMNRICAWMDGGQWERIKWIVAAGYNLVGQPIEALASRINAEVKTTKDQDVRVLLDSLAVAFNVAVVHEGRDVNGDEGGDSIEQKG
jgi:energy-coupling factor transporter ATP-binding protein EcfA2